MVVYHYTSLAVFKSIIENESLWLSNVFFMNDYAEVNWFLRQVTNAIQKRREETKSQDEVNDPLCGMRQGLFDLLEKWIQGVAFEHIYCACFSKKGSDLTQWRAYADDGCGLSIGFNQDALIEANRENMGKLLTWETVEYVEQKQTEIAKDRLQEAENTCVAEQGIDVLELDKLFGVIMRDALRCKNPTFSPEEEERLILMSDSRALSINLGEGVKSPLTTSLPIPAPLGFRPARDHLVPYAKVKAPRSSIAAIGLGPCFGGFASMCAFAVFLQSLGLTAENIRLFRSTATYRSSPRPQNP